MPRVGVGLLEVNFEFLLLLQKLFCQGFSSTVPAALANPGTDPWAWAVLVWLGLINTALVLFLETNSLESVSAAGELLKGRRFLRFLCVVLRQKRSSARAVAPRAGSNACY